MTHDVGILWGVPGLRHHSPDVAAFVGLRVPPPTGKAVLPMGALGGRCVVAVEVVSPGWRENDVVKKVDHYHRAGVPLYVLIDQEAEGGPRRAVAYEWTPAGYRDLAPDGQGRVWVAPLGLWLGVRDGRAACWDGATGKELGDYSAVTAELEEADRRIHEQERAIEEAVEESHRQARLRAEAEAAARAAAAERDALAERMRKLEEQLRQLRERPVG